ncbi:hypothetical protein V6Z12_D05G270100 [Gossypium hirsutum]
MQSWHCVAGLVHRYHLEGGSKISLRWGRCFIFWQESCS